MSRYALAGLSLMVLPAVAPTQAQAQSPDYAALVEAGRPHVSARSLTNEEQVQAKKAIGAWKSKRTEASLAAIRPFADAGDVAALQTMVEGYLDLVDRPNGRGASAALAKPQAALTPLAALWATALFRQSNTPASREVAKAIAPCLSNDSKPLDPNNRYDFHRSVQIVSSQTPEFDCGFDTQGTLFALQEIRNAAKQKKPAQVYAPLTFIERPVLSQADVDEQRLREGLVAYEHAYNSLTGLPNDWTWIKQQADRDPAIAARVKDAEFAQELHRVARGGRQITKDSQLYAYMQADPERIKRHEQAIAAFGGRQINENLQVSATLDKARPEDRESSAWIAIKSSDTANRWWRAYGGNLSGNVPLLPYWCGAGVEEACAQQQQANTAAAFREKYGDPASLNSGRFAGASGSIDQSQFAKERADAKAACLAANINNGAGCTD